ncbi:MAG: hypothetical protein U0836_01055 [Pirellulales bacterium]
MNAWRESLDRLTGVLAHWVGLVGVVLQVYTILLFLYTWYRADELGLARVAIGWTGNRGPWCHHAELEVYVSEMILASLGGCMLMFVAVLFERNLWRLVAFVLSAAIAFGFVATHFWLID